MKILAIIDMQNSFITGELSNKMAEFILPRTAELIKNFDGDVIFTRDTHGKNYLETNEGRHLPVEHCIKGTFGHQIHRDLLGWRDAEVVDKPTFGSFILVEKIRSLYNLNGICINGKEPCKENELEIHLAGTCTDICVISNALILKTVFSEAKIVVHKKCCAGSDAKAHAAALLIMEKCQIKIED
jgi:nicotinamidase-related amidase